MTTWNKELPADSPDEADTLPSITLNEPESPIEPDIQGEGDVAADRRYREGVASTIATKDVEELARRARAALEGAEGDALRDAEARARAREDRDV